MNLPGRIIALILAAALFPTIASHTAHASTVVVPNGLDIREGTGSSGILTQAGREQTVYASTNFPNGPITIRELRFRPNVTDYMPGTAFSATIWDLQIVLSTTDLQPGGLSSIFDNNTGPGAVTVVSGPVTLFSTFTGPDAGPKDFDIVVTLSSPFTYNPAQGNLLVDIQNFSGDPTTPVDADYSTNGAASRVVSGSPISPSGVPDADADVLQISYTQLVNTNFPQTAPTILRQPFDEAVAVGQSAVFSVVATGSPPITYQWHYDGTNVLAGATNSSLPLNNVQTNEAGTYEVLVSNTEGATNSVAATLTVNPFAPQGFICAVLRSDCADAPPPPLQLGEIVTGTDYVIVTAGIGDPEDWPNALQVATDQIFDSIMPLYCSLPKTGCVTDSVQWNIITYDANGNPVTSGCAASGCQLRSCISNPVPPVTNGYITAVLRSDCTSAPTPPPPVGSTNIGPDFVIMTVADADPGNWQYAQQVVTDAVFESLMPLYCALPQNSGIGCVTNRVQWNIITYDINGNPAISGCASSGCQYHYCSNPDPSPPLPGLTIAPAATNIGLSWTSDALDFILEGSSNLVNWYPIGPVTSTNGVQMSAQTPQQASAVFYRLRHK